MDTPGTVRGIVKPASPNLWNRANRSPISRVNGFGITLRTPTDDARIGSAAFPKQLSGVPPARHRRLSARRPRLFNRPHVPKNHGRALGATTTTSVGDVRGAPRP
jgi:hypothetical protein